MNSSKLLLASAAVLVVAGLGPAANAQTREFSFGYDQPQTTGYGFAGDMFEKTLAELSGGTMMIDQFPGAQLGQEPQMLAEDPHRRHRLHHHLDSANAATVAPEAGVVLDPLHVHARGPPGQGGRRSRGRRGFQQDGRRTRCRARMC